MSISSSDLCIAMLEEFMDFLWRNGFAVELGEALAITAFLSEPDD
jgi:hypothetical protein